MRHRMKVVSGVIGGLALLTALLVGAPLIGSAAGTWTLQHGNQNGAMHGVWFTDTLHGVAVGEGLTGGGRILRTVDGGASWIAPTTEPTTDVLNRVMFSDATHGLAVGEYTRAEVAPGFAAALRTSDGGDTWTQATSGTPQGHDLEGVFLFPNGTAWAVGDNGNLIKSTDYGATWIDMSSGVPTNGGTAYSLSSIWFVSAAEGWLGGDPTSSAASHMPLFHTTNATDPNPTWSPIDSNMATNSGDTGDGSGGFESMMFTDATHGWAAADCRTDAQGTCVNSTLAHWNGTTWEDKSPPGIPGFDLQGVWFVDATHGWVVGDSNDSEATTQRVLLFTSDGGNTWTPQPDGITSPSPTSGETSADAGLTYVMAIDICHAWATGGGSTILGFTDTCPASAAAPAATPPALPAAGAKQVEALAPAVGLLAFVLVLPLALMSRRRWRFRRRS